MKNAIAALVLSLFSVSAQAGLDNPTKADAKVIVREVLKMNLEDGAFNGTFKGFLQGKKGESLTQIQCDAILNGGYMCVLGFFSEDADGLESSFDLEVTIRRSKVVSAEITNLKG